MELYAEKVANRGLCAVAQAESLRYKLLGGLAVRRACYGVLRFVMESGAKARARARATEPRRVAPRAAAARPAPPGAHTPHARPPAFSRARAAR